MAPNIHIWAQDRMTMSQATGGEIAGSMDRVARITISLAAFMLVLLIIAPFTFDTDSSGYLASYVIYSLFLTSLGVITVSYTHLTLPTNREV